MLIAAHGWPDIELHGPDMGAIADQLVAMPQRREA